MRVFGADHPDQAAQPGLLEVGPFAAQHGLGAVRVTTYSRGGSPGISGNSPGDTHQMLHILAAPQRARIVRGAVRPGHHHHAGEFTGAQMVSRAVRRSMSGRLWWGQDMLVQCAPWLFKALLNWAATGSGASAVVLISSQAPASALGGSGNSRCCHSMVSSRSASTRSLLAVLGCPVPKTQPLHDEQHVAMLVEHLDVGFDAGGVAGGDRACSSSGRCGSSRRRAVDGHPTGNASAPPPRA